jgi:hypothetical protein
VRAGRLLRHDDDPLQPRHGLEERGRQRSAGDSEARIGPRLDEMVQHPGIDDGIADPGRCDKENAFHGRRKYRA